MLWIVLRCLARWLRGGLRFLGRQLMAALYQCTECLVCYSVLCLAVGVIVFAELAAYDVASAIAGGMLSGIMTGLFTFPAKFIETRLWQADAFGAFAGAIGGVVLAMISGLSWVVQSGFPTSNPLIIASIFSLLGAVFGLNSVMRPLAGAYARLGGVGRIGRSLLHLVWM